MRIQAHFFAPQNKLFPSLPHGKHSLPFCQVRSFPRKRIRLFHRFRRLKVKFGIGPIHLKHLEKLRFAVRFLPRRQSSFIISAPHNKNRKFSLLFILFQLIKIRRCVFLFAHAFRIKFFQQVVIGRFIGQRQFETAQSGSFNRFQNGSTRTFAKFGDLRRRISFMIIF